METKINLLIFGIVTWFSLFSVCWTDASHSNQSDCDFTKAQKIAELKDKLAKVQNTLEHVGTRIRELEHEDEEWQKTLTATGVYQGGHIRFYQLVPVKSKLASLTDC
ncbi:hypothetical protein BaRGS_00031777 [Batillaria attramentaria]|uniref:Uncharacterized protein n=1 Tax=Batillaria attramentaria TaxID=370345 RepID=A0ABD0JQI9_9CAEN